MRDEDESGGILGFAKPPADGMPGCGAAGLVLPDALTPALPVLSITFFLGGKGTTPYNGYASLPDLLPSFTLMNYPLGNEVTAEPSYWTLWAEAKFYALVAICLLVCRVGSRRAIIVFLTLWLFAVTILCLLYTVTLLLVTSITRRTWTPSDWAFMAASLCALVSHSVVLAGLPQGL